MIEPTTNPAKPFRLTFADKHYFFPTKRAAEVAELLHKQTAAVIKSEDGVSPAAAVAALPALVNGREPK